MKFKVQTRHLEINSQLIMYVKSSIGIKFYLGLDIGPLCDMSCKRAGLKLLLGPRGIAIRIQNSFKLKMSIIEDNEIFEFPKFSVTDPFLTRYFDSYKIKVVSPWKWHRLCLLSLLQNNLIFLIEFLVCLTSKKQYLKISFPYFFFWRYRNLSLFFFFNNNKKKVKDCG